MAVTERLSHSELIRLDASSGTVISREYQLTVVSGPDEGQALRFNGGVILGTQPDLPLVLTDPAVSRQHVELRAQPSGLFVRDLRSTNGTFVGGARIDEAVLEEETTLRVGKTWVRIQIFDKTLGVPQSQATEWGEAVGQSRQMRQLFALLERVAPSDSPVILWGETGTGKELLAKGIHDHSSRRAGPFVILDCGAMAPSLIESELFGHVRGAFTGAIKDKRGLLEAADGGTLFFDEIGELPWDLQPKLLRALEAGTYRRVGEDKYRSVEVRIVCATHRNLEQRVREGAFRQDLYFRLAVALVRIPPLRERTEDVALLIRTLLTRLGHAEHVLTKDVLSRAMSYPWPGNVRELRNFVERALLGAGFERLSGELNPPMSPEPTAKTFRVSVDRPFKEAKDELVELFTQEYVSELLAQHQGNMSRAAKAAGLARTYIHRLVQKYGLKGNDS